MSAEANGHQQPLVQPSPVAEVCQVAQGLGPDATLYVVVVFHGPTGTGVHFLDGAAAETVGRELLRLAAITKAGLTVPGNIPHDGAQ